MSFLTDMVKGIDNTSLLSEGGNSSEFSGSIDTGSYILNAAISGSIYGGVPNNKISAFAGESATGKTFFVLGVLKQFLEDNKEGGVIYFDTEAAVTRQMMDDRGIDTTRVVISEPSSIEEFRTNATRILTSYIEQGKDAPPMMLVLDSLGMLSSAKELADTESGSDKRDMTKSQLLRGTFRVLSLKLAKANVPLLVTNHVYDVIGAYIPTKEISGGAGLKYAASSIAMLGKKKDRDGTDVVGNIIKITMHKSRFTKENKKIEVKLSYDTGLDRYYGLVDLAEKYDIFKKVSTRYELPDGRKVFAKAIYTNPSEYFTDDIMAQLEVAAGKEFKYGQVGVDEIVSSTEEMEHTDAS
jgi:RecA/RadA recombinase|tara:strand:+ start:8264 stop:9325 length:1062 start_codon:yes stop_codon:yes gene_type:complete